jgi:hypothetical protein
LLNRVIIQRIIVNSLASGFRQGLNASVIFMWLIYNIPKHLTKKNVIIQTDLPR